MCFFLPVKPLTSTAAVFEDAEVVFFAAAENCVAVSFVHVYAHFKFVFSEACDLFNLLFCGVFEEKAVGVAVKHLDADLLGSG